MKIQFTRKFIVTCRILYGLCMVLAALTGLQAQDLGEPAYSKLTWDQIMNTATLNGDLTIGLTTDNKMYVWGDNYNFIIHTRAVPSGGPHPPGEPLVQTTPYYVPSPAGEKVIKVAAASANIGVAFSNNINSSFFGCLTESGKLYAWGNNTGMFANANAGWPTLPNGTTYTGLDSTVSKRAPQQLTILGESSFVDFAFSSFSNFWVAIGASGKAYHIGATGSGTYDGTFAAIPIPAGANAATFKYVRVWCPTGFYANEAHQMYLKGNDGNIYYSGLVGYGMAMGVPAYYSDANTNTFPDAGGSPPTIQRNLRTDIPQLVPFPAGEDIVKMEFSGGNGRSSETFYAISAGGKAFAAGFWGMGYNGIVSNFTNNRYFSYPLAQSPVLGTELAKTVISGDTLYTLKRFVQIAMPASASKILDIEDYGLSGIEANHRNWRATLIVTDENKAYWAGRQFNNYYIFPNYLQYSDPYLVAKCDAVGPLVTNSQTQWTVEAINYRGIAKMFYAPDELGGNGYIRRFIVSKTGRGYFEGAITAGSGLGKVSKGTPFARYPVPLANEQLDACNPSPGTGGNWTDGVTTPPTNTAVGTIDCSKTQIAPAPVAGTPSQTTLIVSVNVTTAGTFTPLTVSGSGMSLGNGVTSVSTTTTGVQTFYIPIQYDGTPLTNTFQFTVGSAGSCTADLTTKSNKQVTNVWSLTNCSAIMPGVLSK